MSQAYARKYRPANFDDIVGQEHIAVTLKNALQQQNLGHAYLFSGPRGIGKTSTARILAKALNCAQGPTPSPCDTCAHCVEIREGRSLDVMEIDGASNRGIDEIRTLRENVRFSPNACRFKIYIIDEVHMLTTEAFNALLKTLEEPPAHVKFIFATTEPHKVLPTILSRCQRFDFRKISTPAIVEKLRSLIAAEQIQCDDEALFAIARTADGSLRDAEVILDQMNSFSQGRICVADVNSVLGLVSQDAVFSLTDAIAQDSAAALVLVDRLIRDGKDGTQLLSLLIDHFRNLLLVANSCAELAEVSADDQPRLEAQGRAYTPETALYALSVLSAALDRARRQGMPRLFLEMALIKISRPESFLSLQALVEKIEAGVAAGQPVLPAAAGRTALPARASQAPRPAAGATAVSARAPVPAVPPVEPEPAAPVAAAPAGPIDRSGYEARWPEVVAAVKKQKITVGIYLGEGIIQSVRGDTIELGFGAGHELHREALQEQTNLRLIEQVCRQVFGRPVRLVFQQTAAPAAAAARPAVGVEPPSDAANEIMTKFIQTAIDAFDGTIIPDNE